MELSRKRERCLLVFLSPELLCAVIKQLLIHLHEKLQSIVDEAMDSPAHNMHQNQHTIFSISNIERVRNYIKCVVFLRIALKH